MLETIFEIFIIPVLGVLTYFIVTWLRAKTQELIRTSNNELANKYIALLNEIICNCVIATNQTYVDTLKKEGRFDGTAQKEAFKKTYEAVLSLVTDEFKKNLSGTIEDLEFYITQRIEANVKEQK